ncbi:hypothetical protein JCM10213v2_007279 [Rhodosporidiobolus nylandii]
MESGWAAPELPDGCTEQGFAAAVETGRGAGLDIRGTALDTVGWQAAFDEEKEQALMLWGAESGDFGEAKAELGEERVKELLRKRLVAGWKG